MSPSQQNPAPRRAWQRMLSGRRLDLLAPDPADIEISDIARGLARVARWNGQTRGDHAFSVAQHCLLVEQVMGTITPEPPRDLALAALLHDAPEYVIGDLISPFKTAIGYDYKEFELRLLAAIHRRFGLLDGIDASAVSLIKEADRIAAYYEATRLAGFSEEEAQLYFGTPDEGAVRIVDDSDALEPWAVSTAEARFLVRFRQLSEK